ncbi:uncharacterized protein RAG0_15921 [Rhynchosporium agropyri]|uniref:Uncharacterized protein n=2 Tax=Rhynchosporium TaxID=38037 RepID=A0A1E1MVP2_RHYSE|nr:uncharacterized protein RAG0_15921 [Rhynchosporium agropyri]CZT53120.1 uncharacterized protein RSE6_14571 [Rhynchosporium secalis]
MGTVMHTVEIRRKPPSFADRPVSQFLWRVNEARQVSSKSIEF